MPDSSIAVPAPGVFYTPAPLVADIVSRTLGTLLEGRSLRQAAGITILDPACGDGAFLLGAYRYLLDWYRTQYAAAPTQHPAALIRTTDGDWQLAPQERQRILLRHIYGVDLDAQATAATRAALWQLVDADERPAAAGQHHNGAAALAGNIRCGNALVGDDIAQTHGLDAGMLQRINPFNWLRAFPAVMGAGGFALVLGNPPWVALSGKHGRRVVSPAERDYLTARYHGSTYMPNLYEYFVALGLELTRAGGLLSLLVPDRLGFNRRLAPLRERLLHETELLALRYGLRFPGVVADTLVLTLRKQRPHAASVTLVGQPGALPLPRRQAEFLAQRDCAFTYDADAPARALAERLAQLPFVRPLGELFATTSGFGGRSQLIQPQRSHAGQVATLKGDSIGRYALRKRYWFAFIRANLTGRTTDQRKLAAAPRLLLRKTGDRLVATYDESGAFPEQSLYLLYDKRSALPYHFFLGVLNARLLTWYLRARALTNRSSIPQIKKVDLDRLPLPALDLAEPQQRQQADQIADLAVLLLDLYAGLPDASTTAERLARQQQIDQTDRQIDQLVYALYGLSPAEIALVEG